jgi:Tfp pilus assembly protein PilX
MTRAARIIRARTLDEDGFTMIIALGVMLVTSLLLVAAFTVANGDVTASKRDTAQKQSYYASLAGVQAYEYKLQAEPDYWQSCAEPAATVPEEGGERYEVKLLAASSQPAGTKCSTSNPIGTMIETKGSLANTFRIESIGCAGVSGLTSCEGQSQQNVAVHKVVATFQVTGFLDFIYFTNFETEDPGLYNAPAGCEGAYYKTWNKAGLGCQSIKFTTGDSVEGPMHTNDAARVEGTPSFGRKEHSPSDAIEINGDTYPSKECPASGGPTYYTTTKCYTDKGPTLTPPENDTSLGFYVEPENSYEGTTRLVLNGSANTILVSRYHENGEEYKETINWPKNGLIYVKANEKLGCGYTFEAENSDTSAETQNQKGCGNVYVEGTYSKSLTVAGEDDLIIDGSLYPTSVEGKLGSEPTGTAVLGLIASNYVRVYHPCVNNKNVFPGSLTSPWIYAGILSTNHSFIVDNYGCGEPLGKLHDYGAIAQDYRGPVGTSGGEGYLKDYKYDDRLATDEPPYFLAPLKAGWRIIRQTALSAG